MKPPTCFHCLTAAKRSTRAFVLQNGSVLFLIPPKRHGEIYREMFLGWCRPACACFSFLSQRRDHLPFTRARVCWNPTILRPTGSQGPSIQAWVAERKIHAEHPTSEPQRGLLWEEISGLAALLLSCNLPVRWVDLLGFCSVALILIFNIFSRADVRAITCAQQICVWASKVSGEAWGFLIQENGELGMSISWVRIWESE